MSFNASAPTSALHVDLDDIRAISLQLFCGQVSTQEARVAVALLLNPDIEGLRQIEVASGLSADTLLKVLPQSGFSSDFLTCRTRGVFAWEAQDRRPMAFEHRSFAGHNPLISLQELDSLRSEGRYEERREEGDRHLTGVLDPSLDVWSNKDGKLGDAGWTLAMVTLLGSMTFSLGELGRILKLGERQVRRTVERLGSWAQKVKTGRSVQVTVDMSLMLHDGLDLPRNKAAGKARDHQYEVSAVKAMATQIGRTAREMWRNRRAEIRHLREYLDLIPAMQAARSRVEHLINALEQKRRWVGERALRKLLDPLSV